jgi:hypothetical protein
VNTRTLYRALFASALATAAPLTASGDTGAPFPTPQPAGEKPNPSPAAAPEAKPVPAAPKAEAPSPKPEQPAPRIDQPAPGPDPAAAAPEPPKAETPAPAAPEAPKAAPTAAPMDAAAPMMPAPAEGGAAEGGAAEGAAEGAAQPPFQVSVGDVQISGEEFEMDPTTGLITVSGNPRAVRGDEEIRATRMIINPRTFQFTAEGNVIIRQGGREVRSNRATYNFQQKQGQAETAIAVVKAYNVHAEQIVIKPGPVYEARKARFSTCDREHKHYEVYSRVMDVIPGDRMVANDAGVDLLGIRLFTVPRIAKSLREGDDDDRSYLPQFGYDSHNGPYVRKDFSIHRGNPVWIDGDIQINTLREPQGGFLFGTPGRFKYVASVFYRDVAPNQRNPHLQVSSLPEFGLVWSSQKDAQPGRFLGDRVQNVRYPRPLDVSRSWIFSGQVTAGFFRQHHGERNNDPDGRSQNGGRLVVQGQAVLPVVKLGPIGLNDLRLFARQSIYDNEDTFFSAGTGIGKEVRTGHWSFRLDRFDTYTSGKTPFLFDDIELRHEWRPKIEFSSGGFAFSYFTRLDNDLKVYDQVFEFSKLFHCIRPTLTYRTRRNEFFLEIRIPGLSGKSDRRPPGEPRTEKGSDDAPEKSTPPAEMQP